MLVTSNISIWIHLYGVKMYLSLFEGGLFAIFNHILTEYLGYIYIYNIYAYTFIYLLKLSNKSMIKCINIYKTLTNI